MSGGIPGKVQEIGEAPDEATPISGPSSCIPATTRSTPQPAGQSSAEELLARSEARFRGVFEQAAVGMAVRTLDGRWLQVNRKLCEILGYEREELLEISSTTLTPPEDRQRAVDYNRRVAAGEIDAYQREKRYLRKDGTAVWVELNLSVVRDGDGRPDHVISIIVDISERKAAQTQAHAAEERLRAGLENLGEMIVLTDADDNMVIANGRFLEFNRTVADFARPGCHYSDHLRAGIALGMFPDATGRAEAWLAERMAVRRARVGPVERRRQDGRWLMVDDQPLPDGGVVSFGLEITERKAAESALLASEERFRSLVGLTNDVFWETDSAHRFVWQEYSHFPSTRVPPANEIGKTRWEMPYTRPDEDGWRRHRADLEHHRVFRDFIVARPLPEGGERFIQVSGEPQFDDQGNFTGYRGVGKDISEQVIAEDALRTLNADLERRVSERTRALETAYRELEAFSYSVSHDLRAPLRAIAGFATLLREDEGAHLTAEGLRLLGVIDQSAQQMGRLTDALLALAQTSRKTLDHVQVDMETLVREVVQGFLPEYPSIHVAVGNMPAAHGDATLLRQVFVNLIGNALKYSSRAVAPCVEVGVEAYGTVPAVYFVRDNGIGFDMAYVERLFRPFERLHADRDFRGAGIGLALANLIVQRHGGRIWAEGVPGKGAVFRFTLGG
jgi:PAS domain S-box-containing protein